MKSKKKLYLKLFVSTFYISAFTFGGGYVIVPLMKKKFVDDLEWIKEDEIINLTTIAQSSPGAIAVNASILLGYQIAGLAGALITILGTILPPFIILSAISFFYKAFRDNIVVSLLLKGMQAGIAAVIINVVLDLGKNIFKEKSILSVIIMVLSFIAVYFFKINIIYIVLVCGFIGFLKGMIKNDVH
ncbi:MAG: chromate transporter [Spirochaetales bacterium]|nr:chromate transporter [Spirochaetales bacterium]